MLTKMDARGITAAYSWDALHRETGVTYSNGDPSLTFTYDGSSCLSLPACQNIGHRTGMTDGAGSESWAYQVDKTNNRNVHQEQRTTNSSPNNITKTTTYYLDFQNNVTQLVYPTGRIINYTYDSANRPMTAVDSSNGITYATGWNTPVAGCSANAVCYTPQGSVFSMSIGKTSSFTGLNIFQSFNSRLQPVVMSAGTGTPVSTSITSASYPGCSSGSVCAVTFNVASSSGIYVGDTITVSGNTAFFNQTWMVTSVSAGQVQSSSSATAAASGTGGTLTNNTSQADSDLNIRYSFVDPVTLKNAGHVYGITNNLNSSRSQTFAYDQLNRISSAGTSATTGTYCWGYQYSYDAWGNLLSQAGWTPTYNACTESTMGAVTASGNNQISGFSYDASGNALSDGIYPYTWNGESQMKSGAGDNYLYDGDGRRVSKSSGKMYW